MLRVQRVKVDDIYVPMARRKTLHPETVRHLAEDILENGMKTPIQVRHDGKRHVLIEGLHRLEAAKWLGEPRSTPISSRRAATDAIPYRLPCRPLHHRERSRPINAF